MGEYLNVNENERCTKCGSALYNFSKKMALSDGRIYCVKCAEKADRQYLASNSCSICGRFMEKREVKFVLPSKRFGESGMPITERLSCESCYKNIISKSRVKLVYRKRLGLGMLHYGVRFGFRNPKLSAAIKIR